MAVSSLLFAPRFWLRRHVIVDETMRLHLFEVIWWYVYRLSGYTYSMRFIARPRSPSEDLPIPQLPWVFALWDWPLQDLGDATFFQHHLHENILADRHCALEMFGTHFGNLKSWVGVARSCSWNSCAQGIPSLQSCLQLQNVGSKLSNPILLSHDVPSESIQ